jgi:hypothetical protein
MNFIVVGIDFDQQHPGYHRHHSGISCICGHLEGRDQIETLSVEQVVEQMNTNYCFFTEVEGERAEIGFVEREHGLYLRTNPDGSLEDNLLSLPSCRQIEMGQHAHAIIQPRNWS